jgi:16S rRNA (cytidine1402-2'-O)-methyltransferase
MTKLPAGLYLVATPIGTARDITLRALDILASADVLVAEDTRTLRHLLTIHGVPVEGRPVLSHHDHSGAGSRERILAALRSGQSVAYASEAGTPMISDPGYRLVRDAAEAGLPVTAAPGPSAVLAALTVSGLPSDRFLFAGFAPTKPAARRRMLTDLAGVAATVVLYESPRRVQATLADLVQIAGADREVALCRELTKRFEEVLRGSLATVAAALEDRVLKGECVLVLGPPQAVATGDDAILAALARQPEGTSLRDAAAAVAQELGAPRKQVYDLALRARDD